MSKNYQFKTNPPQPSREEIGKHKDFDSLLQQYHGSQRRSARMRRLRVVYASAAIAASIALTLVLLGGLFTAPEQNSMTAEAYFEQQEFAAPPIAALNAPKFASFTIDTEKGGAYEYPNGSKLVVPASAFANDYGRLIEGEVTVHYREMHDFVDFFTSGVPMVYDSAGQQYNLRSAGMVEIYAEQNGQAVKLAAGKSIDIELHGEVFVPSTGAEEVLDYHVYHLDSLIRNWRYYEKMPLGLQPGGEVANDDPLYEEKQSLMAELQEVERRKQEAIRALESTVPKLVKPLRPQPAEGNFATLELDFLNGGLQIEDTENGRVKEELAQFQRIYENVIWKISPNGPAFDERAFRVEWEAARIRPLGQRDYELTLVHPQNELTLIVSPVLFGDDYDRALERYSQELQGYEEAMANREAQLKSARDSILAQANNQEQTALSNFDQRITALASAKGNDSRYLVRRKAVCRFVADKLGVWNCALPVPIEQQALNLNFKDQSGNAYDNHTAYLVDYGSNSLQRFYTGGAQMPALDPNRHQLLWVITDDQRIAVATAEELKSVQPGQTRTLRLRLLDEQVELEEQVRGLLRF